MKRRTMFAWLIISGLFSFAIMHAAIAQSPSNNGVTIVVISDLNEAYGETTYGEHVHKALKYIEELKPDLVICAGDMVAGQNLKLSEENIRAMWKGFDEIILKRLQALHIPLAFTFGNHDGPGSKNFAHERKIAAEFWQKQRPKLTYIDASNFPHYYSFTFKGIFFASIDASTSMVDQQQINWLRQQLAGQAAKSARLQVVLGHLPLYPITQGRNTAGNVLSNADSLHSLLCELGADYYVSGHHHGFYVSRKDNLTMLAAGALGGGPRKLLNSEKPPVKTMTTLFFNASDSTFRMVTHDVTNGMKRILPADLPAELHGFSGNSKLFPGQFNEEQLKTPATPVRPAK